MLVIRVELHSAVTHQITEIARMEVCNVGGTTERGYYVAKTFYGRCKAVFDKRRVAREGAVANYPRLSKHVWCLVARSLKNMGYE